MCQCLRCNLIISPDFTYYKTTVSTKPQIAKPLIAYWTENQIAGFEPLVWQHSVLEMYSPNNTVSSRQGSCQ